MERSEPALVPEWLRCTGSVTGGGTSSHHFATSSHSGTDGLLLGRNRSARNISAKDNPRSAFLDRTSSNNSSRSSGSNGSTKHPYSSFICSHRDKNQDRDKDRPVIRDLWDHDGSKPLGDIFSSKVEKTTLMRSLSLVSRKPGEVLHRRPTYLKNCSNSNHNSGHGVLSGDSMASGIQKAKFKKDFASLGSEEKQGVLDVGRVPYPSLSTAVQSLPIGNSGFVGGERWTSALAEAPVIISGNNLAHSSVQQSVTCLTSVASIDMVGPNMAEALSQAPSRARTNPEIPDKTHRLEELTIKQSRQLIPMTPSIPKALVLNSSDKSRQPKTAARPNEIVAAKSVQQQHYSSQGVNQSLRSGQIRSDAPRTSHAGKFLVLKPVRENGVSSTAKDVSTPANNCGSRVVNALLAVGPSAPSVPLMSVIERKAASLVLNPRPTTEKRPSLSQAQSRSDFFNLMRKKTSLNTSAILPDSSLSVSSSTVKKSGEVIKAVVSAPSSPRDTENGCMDTGNGNSCEEAQSFSEVGEKNVCLNGTVYPEEEEAAFLRSLGWEENAGEDESLTEEEINAFYEEYMKLRPSLKVYRCPTPKCSVLSESHASNSGGGSSDLAPVNLKHVA